MPFPILIMSVIKSGRMPIVLDKERHVNFSLNVLDELQDKTGDISNLGELLYTGNIVNFKNLKWLLALLLNEGAEDGEEPLTERQVGKLIPAGGTEEIIKFVFAAFSYGSTGSSTPEEPDEAFEDDDEDEEDEKNPTSGQGK